MCPSHNQDVLNYSYSEFEEEGEKNNVYFPTDLNSKCGFSPNEKRAKLMPQIPKDPGVPLGSAQRDRQRPPPHLRSSGGVPFPPVLANREVRQAPTLQQSLPQEEGWERRPPLCSYFLAPLPLACCSRSPATSKARSKPGDSPPHAAILAFLLLPDPVLNER